MPHRRDACFAGDVDEGLVGSAGENQVDFLRRDQQIYSFFTTKIKNVCYKWKCAQEDDMTCVVQQVRGEN